MSGISANRNALDPSLPRKSIVSEAENRLENLVNALHGQLDRLKSLNNNLQGELPEKQGVNPIPPPSGGVLGQLLTQVQIIESLVDQIAVQISRLELI